MDKLIAIMKVVLGTAFSLYVKAHSAHWNVEGPFFSEYHRLFGDIYQDTWNSIDDIAEQIRQLDAYAPSSMERLVELSRVATSNEIMAPEMMLVTLMKDTETLMGALTEAFHAAEAENRQGLANFIAERIEAHSKWRWQLRATAKRFNQ